MTDTGFPFCSRARARVVSVFGARGRELGRRTRATAPRPARARIAIDARACLVCDDDAVLVRCGLFFRPEGVALGEGIIRGSWKSAQRHRYICGETLGGGFFYSFFWRFLGVMDLRRCCGMPRSFVAMGVVCFFGLLFCSCGCTAEP